MNSELKTRIEKLERAIASPATPAQFVGKMKEQLAALKAEVGNDEPAPKPAATKKPAAKKAHKKVAKAKPSTTQTLPRIRKDEPVKVADKDEQVIKGHTLVKKGGGYELKIKGTDQYAHFMQNKEDGKWHVVYHSEKQTFDTLEQAVTYVVDHVFKGAVKEFADKAVHQARRRQQIKKSREKAGKPAEHTPAETAKDAAEVIENKVEKKTDKGDAVKTTEVLSILDSSADAILTAVKATSLSASKKGSIKIVLMKAIKEIEKIIG